MTYDPAKISVHQLAQVVAETEPVHGEPYQAGIVITVEDLEKSYQKVQKALAKVKAVKGIITQAQLPILSEGEIALTLAPLKSQAKATEFVKASQISDALQKAGVKFTGLPSTAAAGTKSDEPDSKRKSPGKSSSKAKGGSDGDMPAEKSRSARGSAGTGKSKGSRDSSTSSEKSSGTGSEEPPRFQILAVAKEKVYLADNEAKIKKFIKEGDKFGDFVVKEMADDDGWYVVLENPDTQETVRVEKEKKDKAGDKESKGKGTKKDSRSEDSGEDKPKSSKKAKPDEPDADSDSNPSEASKGKKDSEKEDSEK